MEFPETLDRAELKALALASLCCHLSHPFSLSQILYEIKSHKMMIRNVSKATEIMHMESSITHM